ncbi:MAG: hypothetical protein LBR92_03795 [Puniceicoccales bacterium]|jgi:hypothetical protein|nr:hypothetical protein [Puniceicoccales bacterium]
MELIKRILLGLLVFVGGILNCRATVSEDCREFVSRSEGIRKDIEASNLPEGKKRKRLRGLMACVREKIDEKTGRKKDAGNLRILKELRDQITETLNRL